MFQASKWVFSSKSFLECNVVSHIVSISIRKGIGNLRGTLRQPKYVKMRNFSVEY